MRHLLCALSLCWAVAVQAQSVLHFASLDTQNGQPVQLKAYWYPAAKERAPAVALFHGCGGMYDKRGRVSEHMRDYVAMLNQLGMHALVVDSLTPRGEKQLCTQRIGTRRVTQVNRRLDAIAALQWLGRRPDVDAERIGLMGWSNGASTVLAATNLSHRRVANAHVEPAFAVAFYPGCEAELKRGYEASAKLLMLVGEADDWTAAEPCRQLAEQATGPRPEIESYPGAYHGFDTAAPVRLRADVPGGVHPGQGVHVGGDAQALKRSRERVVEFLKRQL